jgi:Protein of unknown function (DUF1269)
MLVAEQVSQSEAEEQDPDDDVEQGLARVVERGAVGAEQRPGRRPLTRSAASTTRTTARSRCAADAGGRRAPRSRPSSRPARARPRPQPSRADEELIHGAMGDAGVRTGGERRSRRDDAASPRAGEPPGLGRDHLFRMRRAHPRCVRRRRGRPVGRPNRAHLLHAVVRDGDRRSERRRRRSAQRLRRRRQLHEGAGGNLEPGAAALIVLVRKMSPDKLIPNIKIPGNVIQTSLANETEQQLNAALKSARSAASPESRR